jgi:tetratricopeptide (TPR) repeat protein
MGPESFVTRWWKAVRPLPSEQIADKAVLAQKRIQRTLIRCTVWIVVLLAAGWYTYDYIDRAPERARVEFDKGTALMGPKTYSQAIEAFNRAISISPNIPEAHLNRGIALYNLRQHSEALEEYDKATALDPNLTRAYDERGRIYLEKGDTRKAIDEFSKSIAIKPTTDGYYARGLAYESIGEHQKAIEDYDKAIVEMLDAPYAYRARAVAKVNLGDVDGAKADRDQALHIERPDKK